MKPVTPNEFNPVLGSAMIGMAATVGAVGSLARYAIGYAWIDGPLNFECQKILRLAEFTRVRTCELAQTMTRGESTVARNNLRKLADSTWANCVRDFHPASFRRVARNHVECGIRPQLTLHDWVTEIICPTLDSLDRIQADRMFEYSLEWLIIEQFKQDLVDLWGKQGFDVSRSHGRERNYVLRQFWKNAGKCILYPTIAMAVVVAGVYVAYVTGVGM